MLRLLKAFGLLIAGGLAFMVGHASAATTDVEAEISRLERQEPSPEKRAEAVLRLGHEYLKQNRLAETEVLYRRAASISAESLGTTHTLVFLSLDHLARIHYIQGKYAQAELVYWSVLGLREKTLGPQHADVASTLFSLAQFYFNQGKYLQAEALFKRSLATLEKALGSDHLSVATVLNELAKAQTLLGRHTQAEPMYKRSLAMFEKARGLDNSDVANILNNLGFLYHDQGQHAQAQAFYRRSLAIQEKALGPDHRAVGDALNNLADLYRDQGLYDQAEPLHKRALAIREKALGPQHPDVASTLFKLAQLGFDEGKYVQAETLFNRSLAIMEKALGPDHLSVATVLNDLANFQKIQGQYEQAELMHKRSLAIREKALGQEHPDVAMSMNNLGSLYQAQGQHAQAEVLYKQSLAIREKALGPDHRDVGKGLNNLAGLYRDQGLYEQAEPLLKRSFAIIEKALGPDHDLVATILNNLALIYSNQGQYLQAESLGTRSLAITEKVLGPDHPSVATILNNLATMYQAQRKFAQAEPLYMRSLAIMEKVFGLDQPSVATSLNNLASLFSALELNPQALSYSRQATAIHRRRVRGNVERQAEWERRENSPGFLRHLSLLDKVEGRAQNVEITGEGFALAQLLHASDTAYALSKSMARSAAPNDELADLVRRDQDARARYQRLNEDLVKAWGTPSNARSPENESRLRSEINQLDKEIERLTQILAKRFPDYGALISLEPVSLDETQKLLRPDEAMLVYSLEGDRAYLWVVRQDKAQFLSLTVKPAQVTSLANRVRASLVSDNPLITPFDAAAAHDLYRELFAPALPYLDGVTDILVVPSGPLTGLPLGVLVGSPPKEGTFKLEDHRQLDWLMKRYIFSTLPAVISLKALRMHGKPRLADQLPFFGIGDPVLDGDAGETRGGKSALLPGLFPRRGSMANVDALRKLPSLPDTNDELQAISKVLGGDPNALYLRQRATESNAKAQSLERYRVIAFATHGLLGGEATGVAEPGLVLTPPPLGTIDDDGYLGASEVAQLKLNAEWVVLSACNTAGADGTPGAAGLTGLAKAFFYAGARALLVSHWPVISSATTKLITDTFQHHSKNPDQGKSAALRQAMLDMMNDADRPEQAHPAFWAPFVVVGDGR